MGRKRFLHTTDAEIERLLKNASPTVAFQPIVDTCSAGIMGFEALVNASDSACPPNSPWESFNENTCNGDELLFRLDMASIESAVRSSRALTTELRLFINVRDYSLERISSCADYFMIFLESLEIDSNRMVIEISESIDPDHIEYIAKNIQALQKKGIQIAIDNIGQNYAGLLHMQHIEPDYLKLDSSLIGEIDMNANRQNVVLSLSQIAEKMDVPIIAMGVESKERIETLNKLGIPFAQWSVPIHPIQTDSCFGRLKGKRAKHTNETHRPAMNTDII